MQRVIIFLLLLPATLLAQREPVLKQIDLPHPYYYREMYLPQLTSGPSWVTWSPDSKEVIYSMAGSLWRQKIDSAEAVQLTDGPGYDYQPDWSHDGKYVVYTKYDHDAMELWLLDLATGKAETLTKDGAVDVEPRWSPDGKRIAYVSTAGTKHFHIFLMEMDGGMPKSIRQLTKENVSMLPRYYYSKFDHEISPAWSPDGKDIIFVSNHGHIHGTGGIWRATVPDAAMIDTNLGERTASAGPREPDARAKSLATEPSQDTPAKEIHYEETNWKARPEFSPDGKKIVYASYLGRQWHQLWLMPSQGGDVFPLTYGDYDNINPRWSPDGGHLAFISNSLDGPTYSTCSGDGDIGGTRICLQAVPGDATSTEINIRTRLFVSPIGHLRINVPSSYRKAVLRISIRDSTGRTVTAPDAQVHADDSFFKNRPYEFGYFYSTPTKGSNLEELTLSIGDYSLAVSSGIGLQPFVQKFRIEGGKTSTVTAAPLPIRFPIQQRDYWSGGDLHVHSNYGGSYIEFDNFQALGESLKVVQDLVVNKEQRFPNLVEDVTLGPETGQEVPGQISTGQEFHTSYWGHLGLLNIKHLIIPGYAGYPNTAAASLVPMDADVADMAHAQYKDALVGWVHPFDVLPDPYKDAKLTNELPIDVALGKVDYYEVVGFSDHKASAAIWYRLLNLGFHLPAGAGTDAMTNFASLRGPVGLNRVYVNVPPGPLKLDEWLKNLKAGKTFATNGPLLRFTLDGQPIGGEVKLAKPGEVRFTAALRSIVPVDKVGVVCNGAVVRTIFGPGLKPDFSSAPDVGLKPHSPSGGADEASAPTRTSPDRRSRATQATAATTNDSQGHVATTSLDVSGTVPFTKSGWCVLRAYSDHAEEPIMDIYPYGTTSPIYVTVAGEKPRSPEDAKFFSKWIERVREDAAVHPDYNTPQEREHVLKVLDEAAQVYAGMER